MSVPARHRQAASAISPRERLPLPPPQRVIGLTRAPATPESPAVHEQADAFLSGALVEDDMPNAIA